MPKLVAAVADKVCTCCHAKRCRKGACSISLDRVPAKSILVDLDCTSLQESTPQERCDYLFFAEESSTAWVAPVELKSGGFNASKVVRQLLGGVTLADRLLPAASSFQLVPVLACGKVPHRKELQDLRCNPISLRGRKAKTVLLRCGQELKGTLTRGHRS